LKKQNTSLGKQERAKKPSAKKEVKTTPIFYRLYKAPVLTLAGEDPENETVQEIKEQ
jgi:hypothetical protein